MVTSNTRQSVIHTFAVLQQSLIYNCQTSAKQPKTNNQQCMIPMHGPSRHIVFSNLACGVAVHLVHADANLFHAQQIDETRVLTSLSSRQSSSERKRTKAGVTGALWSCFKSVLFQRDYKTDLSKQNQASNVDVCWWMFYSQNLFFVLTR